MNTINITKSSPKQDWEITHSEVTMKAMELNSPVLYNCIQMHRYGDVTWEQAMQMAALVLSAHNKEIMKQLIEMKSQQIPVAFIEK